MMSDKNISDIAAVVGRRPLDSAERQYIFRTAASFSGDEYDELLFRANALRRRFKGNRIKLCSIINAKSGMCPEDCRFCAQSVHARSEVKVYDLVDSREIAAAAMSAAAAGAGCFGIVSSGRRLSDGEILRLGDTIKTLADSGKFPKISASLGELEEKHLKFLKERGLAKYHHNIETSENFFPSVCTTHSYADRVKTLKAVKNAALELCCGCLFGLGETWDDRMSAAAALEKIRPDSVPLNFLNPVKGTALESSSRLLPREILGIIAAFRFILPASDISVCGGREANLGDMQSWIFYAGANGMMTGGYLTTPGRSSDEDKKMIRDLGLEIAE